MIEQQKMSFDDSDPILDGISAEEGIRQGLEDAKAGRLRPIREFFAEFEATHPAFQKKNREPIRLA
jgi:hypothetical protein